MLRNKINLLLLLVLAFSLILRIYQLDKTPSGLYWDEMDAGYQAYSILKTGKDYFGHTPSLVIHSFADFRAPVLIYLTIPFVYLFDLTAYAVRLPSAILGTVNVLLIFVLAKILFKNSRIALVAAILTSLSPWSFHYSRIAFEVTAMMTFFLAGVIGFLKGLNNPKWYLVSAVSFAITLFTYNTAKLFTPLFIFVLLIIYIRKKNLNILLFISLFIFGALFIISLYGSVFLGGGQRFSEISIFSDTSIASKVDVYRHYSGIGHSEKIAVGQKLRLADKFIYNKISFLLDNLTSNYLQVFSSNFLFLRGDPNLRHSPGTGEFFRIEFITMILGIFALLYMIKKGDKNSMLLLAWIILAPVPSIVTREGGNHATRLFFLFPALTLTSTLGMFFLLNFLPKKISGIPLRLNIVVGLIISSIWIFAAMFYINYYFGIYRLESAKVFQTGFSEAVKTASAYKDSYDYVIIDDRTDSALMNYLFETKYDPATFQAQIHTLPFDLEKLPADKIDNIVMLKPGVKDWSRIFQERRIDAKYLLIISQEQLQESTIDKVQGKLTGSQTFKDVIYAPDGSAAFYIIESNKPLPGTRKVPTI